VANKFDYFPLYFRRLLIDTDDMTTLEFGAYMRLLLKAWDEKIPGKLPNSASDLARKARVDDATWEKVGPTVLARFKDLDKPHITQKFMRQVYADLCRLKNEKSKHSSAAAKSMWDRKKHANALREHSGGNANKTKTENKTKPEGEGNNKPPIPLTADFQPPEPALLDSDPGPDTLPADSPVRMLDGWELAGLPAELQTREFRDAFASWILNRREAGESPTAMTVRLNIGFCAELGHDAAIAAVKNSTRGNYKKICADQSSNRRNNDNRTPSDNEIRGAGKSIPIANRARRDDKTPA
jgi:uncharacterized protein YdaU (DUF1376 family)